MTETSGLDELEESSSRLAERLAQCALTLARRFSDGATLWSVAPGRRDHGLHVAVEFVHPAIVGKPALPAVAIVEPDVIDNLRHCVRAGDAVVCIGPGDDADLLDIVRRGPAWGVETIWIGWGPTPTAQSTAMPLWLSDGDDASVVRGYHLLWELTHVCLEQPDVLRSVDSSAATSCPTCADDLILAEVVATPRSDAVKVRTSLGVSTVDTTLIDPVAIHDLVLTQAGVALQALDGMDHE